MLFLYAAFFSPEQESYPVKCIHEMVTGKSCPSCGLSRSLGYIVRGNLQLAGEMNIYGMRIFLFFLFQLVMRISNIVFLRSGHPSVKQLIILDWALAVVTFLLSFSQFFPYYYNLLS